MAITLALDIYGTLIDPLAITTVLADPLGDDAGTFVELWRTKQLEYSFRRGLMRQYRDFAQVTRAALDFACEVHGFEPGEAIKTKLMDHYRQLQAFPDAAPALTALKNNDIKLHAFSNGVAGDITALLKHAALDQLISSIVSADEVQTFKPDPRLYAHFLSRTGGSADSTWLVSSNPFDVIGATACGWRTIWVKRNAATVFDQWEHAPTAIVSELTAIPSVPAFAQAIAASAP